MNCVAHTDALEGSEQVAPAGVLDCSTVVAMDAGARVLLVDPMVTRAAGDEWARRHFKNRSYQPAEGFQSPKNAVIAYLATMIGEQRLLVSWLLGFDLTSLGFAILPFYCKSK